MNKQPPRHHQHFVSPVSISPPNTPPPEPSPPPAPSEVVTKSFSLTREEVAIIEAVRRDEGHLSDSAALRRLIRAGGRGRPAQGDRVSD